MIKWLGSTYRPVFRFSLIIALWCMGIGELQAQGGPYFSRDNHSGLSHHPSSWEGAMPPANSTTLTDSKVTIRGYLMHGLANTPSNVSFSGPASLLVVEDTLRIHGDLNILNGAGIHIKPGGVLIVHGNYLQKDNVTFKNEGKAVFVGSWKWAGSGSYSSSGEIYTIGTTSGGVVHGNEQDLWVNNRALYHFSKLTVLKEGCVGTSGNLTVSGTYIRVVHWESSTDYFKSSITKINSQESTLSYSNLRHTTSYRVYLETSAGQYEYSAGATIVVLKPSEGGTISGPSVVCASGNNGTLSLSSFTGSVVRWESSLDGFASSGTTVATGGESYSFSNLSQTTSYRAVVNNGNCTEDYSEVFTVKVDPESNGGSLSGATTVCAGDNKGELLLSGHTGTILRWESSTDNAVTFQPLDFAGTAYTYENISTTTHYRAVVKSGSCAEKFSSVATVEVSTVAGGELRGSQAVCAGENSGSLSLGGHRGNILRWESSTDGFVDNIEVLEGTTTASFNYENLSRTMHYRAVIGNEFCAPVYSKTAVITVEEAVIAGTLIASASTVCADSNEGHLSLNGHSANILRWEKSTDNFATITAINTIETEISFLNLSTTTSYRAVLDGGVCGEVLSPATTIVVDAPAVGGNISGGGITVCAEGNSGSLQLLSYSGTILRWESSIDGFDQHIEQLGTTTAELSFQNLTETTSFRAVVGNGSCPEVYSSFSIISVGQPSEGGTISGPSVVCASGNNGTLTLGSFTGSVVRWESSLDGFASSATTVATGGESYSFSNLSQTTSYRAVVKNGNCTEDYSAVFTVKVDPESNGGTLSGATTVCAGDNKGELLLSGHTGTILRWESSTDNAVTFQPLDFTGTAYTYENISTTTHYRAVVQSGSCAEKFSSVATVEVNTVAGGALSGSQTVCAGENSGSLLLSGHRGNILRWESSTDGFATLTTIASTAAEMSFLNLTVTTSFRAVVWSEGCGERYSEPAVIEMTQPVEAGAVAGATKVKSGKNSGLLRLENYSGNIVQWEQSKDNFITDVQVVNHQGPEYSFEDIEEETWFRVLVQQGSCPSAYSLPAKVSVNHAPVTVADTFYIEAGSIYTSETSLLRNDYDIDGDALIITAGQGLGTAAGNSLDIHSDGRITFEAQPSFSGTDTYEYRICDDAGEASRCTMGTIVLIVEQEPAAEEKPVIIYDGFSPNGDGRNDLWIIDYIEQYRENLVQVFDRHGVLVYEMKGYDNEQKVFEGYSNKGAMGSGGLLPEATYFYRIVLSREQPVKTGYFILNR